MGCLHSQLASESQPNIFNVVIIPEVGPSSSCRLEITDSHIALHKRGTAVIRWPLRFIRNYGYDQEHFSFESGSNAPTGPGFYYFKCHNPAEMFRVVQTKARNLLPDSRASLDCSSSMAPRGGMDTLPSLINQVINHTGEDDLNPYLSTLPGVNDRRSGVRSFPIMEGTSCIPCTSPVPIGSPAASLVDNSNARDIQNTKIYDRDDERPPSTLAPQPPLDETPSTSTDQSMHLHKILENRTAHSINANKRASSYSSARSDQEASRENCLDRQQAVIHQGERLGPMTYSPNLYSNVDINLPREQDYVCQQTDFDSDLVQPLTAHLIKAEVHEASHSGSKKDTDEAQFLMKYTEVDINSGSYPNQTAPSTPDTSVVSEFPQIIDSGSYPEINFRKTEAFRKIKDDRNARYDITLD